MRLGIKMMLTDDSIWGSETALRGWATRAYPAADLEKEVIEMAQRIAKLPPDIVQLAKRVVRRQREIMGLRTGIPQGMELCAMGTHQTSFEAFSDQLKDSKNLTTSVRERDETFGDY